MSDDNLDNIELVEQTIEKEIESEQPESPAEAEILEEQGEGSNEPEEEGEKSLDKLPLPGDEDADKTKTLPKWVEKKLSRKDREIEQAAQEAAAYRAQLEQIQNGIPQSNLPVVDPEMPKRDAYIDEAEFISAVVEHKQKRSAQVAQYKAQQDGMRHAENNFQERLKKSKDEGAEKYDDFDEKIKPLFSKEFPANRAMAEAIVDSDYKGDILYFLGENKDKAKEIALMNPVKAVKEISKIEARFEERKKNIASKAPKPIDGIKTNQVKGATINNLQELTKNSSKMSQKEFESNYAKLTANSNDVW